MPNYTKNPTWADGSGGGTPITAAKLNNVESGIFDAHYQAAVRVYHNADQSINNVTNTMLAFNTERFDTESNASSTMHDTVTNNSRLTCRTAGKYQITANIEWAGNATGSRSLRLVLNGSTVIANVNMAGSTTVTRHLVTTFWDLAVNDYVEVQVTQDSGGALNVLRTDAFSPEFMMVKAG